MNALSSPEDGSVLAVHAMAAILRVALFSSAFWEKLSENSGFTSLLQRLLLSDPRKAIRTRTIQQIQDTLRMEWANADSTASGSTNESAALPLTQFFWSTVLTLLPSAANAPNQCEEIFRITHFFLNQLSFQPLPLLEIPELATKISELLLAHTCIEVCTCSSSERRYQQH